LNGALRDQTLAEVDALVSPLSTDVVVMAASRAADAAVRAQDVIELPDLPMGGRRGAPQPEAESLRADIGKTLVGSLIILLLAAMLSSPITSGASTIDEFLGGRPSPADGPGLSGVDPRTDTSDPSDPSSPGGVADAPTGGASPSPTQATTSPSGDPADPTTSGADGADGTGPESDAGGNGGGNGGGAGGPVDDDPAKGGKPDDKGAPVTTAVKGPGGPPTTVAAPAPAPAPGPTTPSNGAPPNDAKSGKK